MTRHQEVASRLPRVLSRSASPADSFRLRASTSILRNCPTRSASHGKAMPCSAFSSSNSIWRMAVSGSSACMVSAGLINAPDRPSAGEDGVVRAVLIDPGAETGGAKLEGIQVRLA
jgi:hypothetical protein